MPGLVLSNEAIRRLTSIYYDGLVQLAPHMALLKQDHGTRRQSWISPISSPVRSL